MSFPARVSSSVQAVAPLVSSITAVVVIVMFWTSSEWRVPKDQKLVARGFLHIFCTRLFIQLYGSTNNWIKSNSKSLTKCTTTTMINHGLSDRRHQPFSTVSYSWRVCQYLFVCNSDFDRWKSDMGREWDVRMYNVKMTVSTQQLHWLFFVLRGFWRYQRNPKVIFMNESVGGCDFC